MKERINIGICGLGLIGGSLAKAFRKRCGAYIVALDMDNKSIEKALAEKVIDEGTDRDYTIFNESDIVIISVPINAVADTAIKISRVSRALITDTASTKRRILENIPQNIRFIGGHPMAGSELNGYSSSDETLFENAVYALIKGGNPGDMETLKRLIETIGAIPLELSREEHDLAVGKISHLPHSIAATLVNLTLSDSNGISSRLAAGGFKDITRIASSDGRLWEQILSSSDTITGVIGEYIGELTKFKKMLNNKDSAAIIKYLESAAEKRNGLFAANKGLIPEIRQLLIEVTDRPGIIGEITTLLGHNSINIKNLYIENNREYEGGVLRITLEKASDSPKAVELLLSSGYKAQAR
jgi:prephenate dehydrogenase